MVSNSEIVRNAENGKNAESFLQIDGRRVIIKLYMQVGIAQYSRTFLDVRRTIVCSEAGLAYTFRIHSKMS